MILLFLWLGCDDCVYVFLVAEVFDRVGLAADEDVCKSGESLGGDLICGGVDDPTLVKRAIKRESVAISRRCLTVEKCATVELACDKIVVKNTTVKGALFKTTVNKCVALEIGVAHNSPPRGRYVFHDGPAAIVLVNARQVGVTLDLPQLSPFVKLRRIPSHRQRNQSQLVGRRVVSEE